MRTAPARWQLVGLFFFSGFASLTYQVAWQRVLTQVIGVDAYSIALIVSVFMLGLGLGGLSATRLVGGRVNLLVVYAVIEAALGIFGFFSVGLIRALNAWLAPLTPGLSVEFIANFVLLAAPTLLMGLTLPLMVHLVRNSYLPGTALGVMYSANVTGAAVGTLVTGFLLIGTIGLTATCRTMAAVNLAITVCVLLLARGTTAPQARTVVQRASADRPEPMSWALIVASLTAGFVALAYEIVFFCIFTAYFGMVSYVFPLLLASYLTAMAIGNAAFGFAADRRRPSLLASFAAVGATVTTLAVLLGPLVMLQLGINQERLELERFPNPDTWAQLARVLVVSLILMTPIAFASGMFPILVRAATRDSEDLGRKTGLIYFTQTMGNTAGVLTTALLLLPMLGTVATLRLLGAFVLALPLLIALTQHDFRPRVRLFASTLGALALVVAYPSGFYSSVRDFYDAYRNGMTVPLAPAIVREDAVGVTLAYPIPEGYWINVGRERSTPLVSRAGAWEVWPLELVAAVKPDAKRALITGVGPGVHLPALERLYPGISIDVVDLNPTLIDLMRENSEPTIRDGLERANVVTTDGRRFVLKNPAAKYDIIQIGPNHASTSGAGNLFSREFLTMLRDRLSPDGVVTFNAYSPGARAALDVFSSVAVAIPGDAGAARAAADASAAGSGARVSHVIAWNVNAPAQLRERFMREVARYPSLIPVSTDAPALAQRPNWSGGCVLLSDDVRALLSSIPAATDDLPATEYFLTQRQNVPGVDPASDSRDWGHPAACIPLDRLATSR